MSSTERIPPLPFWVLPACPPRARSAGVGSGAAVAASAMGAAIAGVAAMAAAPPPVFAAEAVLPPVSFLRGASPGDPPRELRWSDENGRLEPVEASETPFNWWAAMMGEDGGDGADVNMMRGELADWVRRKKEFLHSAFIPENVSPDYYRFTCFRFCQRIVSSTVGVFGTQSLLLALGLKSGRIGQAAALSWVLKEGLGRLGKLFWASTMGKDFDVQPKRWRFRSALLYSMGNGMEILTQVFPAYFLLVATLANTMKQVSVLTAASTRNAFYKSFSGSRDNIANITAKGEAQVVVADLIGMGTGIMLSKFCGAARQRVFISYVSLTLLDILGIYQQMRSVVFRTINPERASLIIKGFLHNGEAPTPDQVSTREKVLFHPDRAHPGLFSDLPSAIKSRADHLTLLSIFKNDRYLVSSACAEDLGSPAKRLAYKRQCKVVLRHDATGDDVLKALLTLSVLRFHHRNRALQRRLAARKKRGREPAATGDDAADEAEKAKASREDAAAASMKRSPERAAAIRFTLDGGGGKEGGDVYGLIREAKKFTNGEFGKMMSSVEKRGWTTNNYLFGTLKKVSSW